MMSTKEPVRSMYGRTPRQPLAIGLWGKRFAPAHREAMFYNKRLVEMVTKKYGEVRPEHEELIQAAVRAEYLSRCMMIDVRYSLDGRDDEKITHKARLDAMKQSMYLTKERLLALRQLGILDAEVRSASGREEANPFGEVDSEAE